VGIGLPPTDVTSWVQGRTAQWGKVIENLNIDSASEFISKQRGKYGELTLNESAVN
jgi:hypothetical protein